MVVHLRYRGLEVTDAEVGLLRELIAAHPEESRRALSIRVCEMWDWRQSNGELRDCVCRTLMLKLHRAGWITLPPPRFQVPNNAIKRRKPREALAPPDPFQGRLGDLGPIHFEPVRRTAREELFDTLIEKHHYLGYTRPVGEHLKVLVSAKERPIACFAWSSAPYHLSLRDRFIGWSREARTANRHLLAYNTRFLIVPWVRVPHLASHLLGQMARRISALWQGAYGHPILYLETFVDTERFAGTCYRAANWIALGLTSGRGKDCPTRKPNRSLKQVMGYALRKHFRQELSRVQ